MTGTMVAVKGMLSTNAEKTAEAHRISTIAMYWRDSIGAAPTMSLSVLAMKRRRPGRVRCQYIYI
jgi:hypothetical protein